MTGTRFYAVPFLIEVPRMIRQDADPLVLETRRYNCHCSERAPVVMLIQTVADVGNRESTRPGGTARTHNSLAIDLGPTRHGVLAVRAVTRQVHVGARRCESDS